MTIILVIAIIAIYCLSFWLGYWKAMGDAADKLDQEFEKKFKDAGIVVKKDDRIIECNGMMIPMQCKKCRFGRVNEGDVECFAQDYDGVPVFGVTKDENLT